jgi:hypothetical protein
MRDVGLFSLLFSLYTCRPAKKSQALSSHACLGCQQVTCMRVPSNPMNLKAVVAVQLGLHYLQARAGPKLNLPFCG